ncbi:hypothetical protein OG788_22675 [Streptomyces sp. NBC_00647]|uniref:hypothetical protein n=1 Tax=Streptomyces sp. NBC_00647 TaxID=2975796 RepID=UPI003246D9BB
MPSDPYAVLRALLRAEAARDNAPAPEPSPRPERHPVPRTGRDEQGPGTPPEDPRV